MDSKIISSYDPIYRIKYMFVEPVCKYIRDKLSRYVVEDQQDTEPIDFQKMSLKQLLKKYPEISSDLLRYLAKIQEGKSRPTNSIEELAEYMIDNFCKLNRTQKLVLVELVKTIELQKKFHKYLECCIQLNSAKAIRVKPIKRLLDSFYDKKMRIYWGMKREDSQEWGVAYNRCLFVRFNSKKRVVLKFG